MKDCGCAPDAEKGCCSGLEVEVGGCSGMDAEIPAGSASTPQPQGARLSAIVTSTGPVYKGEFVHRELEYIAKGEALRWVQEGVKILTTAELSEGRVGVIFTQNGKTKFKIVALENDAVALGNALVLLEDEELEEAALVELTAGRCAVIYARDGGGEASIITLAGRTATLAYADIWVDEGEPGNLTACQLPCGYTVISATLGAKAANLGGNPGECWVWAFREVTSSHGMELDVADPNRMDGNNDTDVYAGGWSLVAADDYTAVLTYPQAVDKPVGYAVIDINDPDAPGAVSIRFLAHGKYAQSLPAISSVGLSLGRWLAAYGVCWLSADRSVNKSGLAFEVWGLSRYAAELMWYGNDETRYRAAIGNISVASAGPQAVAITYTGSAQTPDGGYTDETRAVYMSLEDGPAPGAAVLLPQHSGFCRLVPISVTKAILIWGADGNGYAQYMVLEERVMPIKHALVKPGYGLIDAFALTGGEANAAITVQVPEA